MKKSLSRILSLPLRAWRSRGFGVHSPYAYRFITTVLRPTGEYYDYAAIGSDSLSRRLYRVLLDLAPATIVRSGPLSPSQDTACTLAAAAVASAFRSPKSVIVSPGAIVGITYLRRVLASGGSVIFTDLRDTRSSEIFAELVPDAMAFAGIRLAVLTGAPGLPHQLFPLLM